MKWRPSNAPGLLTASLFLAGCATVTTPDYLGDLSVCRDHLMLEAFGPAQADDLTVFYRPDDQPYFTISRPHALFDPAEMSATEFSEWKVLVIDHSWQQLEAHQLRTMGGSLSASRGCLVELAQATPESDWQQYAEDARDYDHYRDWQRWAGLYPLTSLVVAQRIRASQADWRDDYGGPFDRPARQYSLASDQSEAPSSEAVSDWFSQAYEYSALGLPQLTSEQRNQLLAMHAPVINVLQESDADRLGYVTADQAGARFTHSPSLVYTDSQFTRFGDEHLLQLNYTVWFEERPKTSALDIYGGPWNGLTWRVTLDTTGQPLWYDVIHNCGCYHQVWLSDQHQPRADLGREEPLFLPFDWSGRPHLTLESGTHYVRRVTGPDAETEQIVDGHHDYHLVPYRTLTRLPDAEGENYYSLFDQAGFIAESRRAERFVLWPFGVKSPGAMRQSGTHTIAFIGKRHFDSPTLFEQLVDAAPQD